MLLLKSLLPNYTFSMQEGNIEISGITLASNLVRPGQAFVALQGEKFHGLDFISEVKQRGVAVILSDKPYQDKEISVIYIKDLKFNLASILTRFYGDLFPETLVAVTGTNGKTSVTDYIFQFLKYMQVTSCLVGTIGVKADFTLQDFPSLTTPDICSFYSLLAESKKNNCDHFIFEASSHALALGRISGILVDVAAFTNLSQDHFDFHGNFENYYQAKSKLFLGHLKQGGRAIINVDDEYGRRLCQECKSKGINVITYGKKADFSYEADFVKGEFNILYKKQVLKFRQHFLAEFELTNLVCALSCLASLGYDLMDLLPAIEGILPAAGRMQKIYYAKKEANIVIDFAHTPDALEKVLLSLRENCQGKIYALFGCGGNRDKGKRSIMGKIAADHADYVIITDDNPRNEDPKQIRDDVLKGCLNALSIAGRKQAIHYALDKLEKNDILLIAGKGHENYQIIGNEKKHFSDYEEVKLYIE